MNGGERMNTVFKRTFIMTAMCVISIFLMTGCGTGAGKPNNAAGKVKGEYDYELTGGDGLHLVMTVEANVNGMTEKIGVVDDHGKWIQEPSASHPFLKNGLLPKTESVAVSVVTTGGQSLKANSMIMENARVAAAKEKDALAVVRYAVQSLLRWTPRDAAEHLTPEIVQKLKLDEVIKYVIYPPDLSRADDRLSGYRWLLHKAFPAEVGYDIKYQALGIYEQVRTGKLKQFPRYLFRGPDSRRKLAIMLLDYISRCIPASDVEDLYIKFSNPLAGIRILKKASLYYAYKEMFESPILFLHYALGDSGDPFLFNYYLFADVERAMKAEKEAEEKAEKKKAAEAIKSEE